MVVAGEVSGDMHAAHVVREIKNISPDVKFFGMGSKKLREEGVQIVLDPTEISTIGFFEAFKNIKKHMQNLKLIKNNIKKLNPDVLFLVDYSGFNMLLARYARKQRIPVVSYFSPSAWVWGKWRASWMAYYRATIAAVFPMEAIVYRNAGARVRFVGHPLQDVVDLIRDKKDIYNKLEINPRQPVIGLLPGSRRQEVSQLLPEILKAAEKMQRSKNDYQFVIPLAPGISSSYVAELAANYNLVLKLVDDSSYEVMQIADLLITASGTATLEAAIIGTPMIITYKVSKPTYLMGKMIVNLDYIGLPNIIAGKEIVPEFVQKEASGENIYRKASELLNKPEKLDKIKEELKFVQKKLGSRGAIKRTAELVLREGRIL